MTTTFYVIIPTVEITDSMIEASLNQNDSIRYSNDESLAILKFDTPFPNVMQGYVKYNHSQILEEISNSEWEVT